MDALVSAPGFPREEPNVWNLLRRISFLELGMLESLSHVHRHLHGSLAEEVSGAAVPLRDIGHDSCVEQPFCTFQVETPSAGTALKNIENRQEYNRDQYRFVSRRGLIFYQSCGDQLQALTLGLQIEVDRCFERETWAFSGQW